MLVVCATGLVMGGVFQLVYSLPVQSHALASVHILKIPNADSHTIVWTHETTGKNGQHCSCGYCDVAGQTTGISRKKCEVVCCPRNSLASTP